MKLNDEEIERLLKVERDGAVILHSVPLVGAIRQLKKERDRYREVLQQVHELWGGDEAYEYESKASEPYDHKSELFHAWREVKRILGDSNA